MEKQRTFGAIVGMESLVQTRLHMYDFVECSDGCLVHLCDVYEDCRGGYHSNKDDRHDEDVTIVTEVLNNIGKWADEYCTENTDYADAYTHIIKETSYDWHKDIVEWVEAYCTEHMNDTSCAGRIADIVFDDINGEWDSEPEYSHNEEPCYYGHGCCLWGTAIGENEEQIDISCWEELALLHSDRRLDDVLDDVNCDVTISRSRKRGKNEETGRYEYYGRETYIPHAHNAEHPTFEIYTMPGGRWDFVVSADRMAELVTEAIIKLCRMTGHDRT